MAESEPKQPAEMVEGDEKNLKYLDFVLMAAIYMVICFSSVYRYAKENSGPLKPGVRTVEDTVRTVIGPVCDKFYGVPFQLLKFVDHKIDESLRGLDRQVPSQVKRVSIQARAVAYEIQRTGVVDAAMKITKTMYSKYEPTARELYYKYEPVAEQYAVLAWRSLNRLPLFPQVAQIAVPTAAFWSEKYNQVVGSAAEGGYTIALYLPLIPIERISKVFDESIGEPVVSTNGVVAY